MKKYLVPTLSAALLSFAVFQAAPVYADMKKPCPKEGKCIMEQIGKMKADLKLTPEQAMKLKAIKDKGRDFMHKTHDEMRKVHEESEKLAHEKDMDMKKLDALAAKAGRIESDMIKHRVMVTHEIEKILTPEQHKMLDHDKKEMKKNMRP
jgi:Spy/CpxP family protein refolding chaperone